MNFTTAKVTIEFINPEFAIPSRDPENSQYSKRLLIHLGAGSPGELSYGYYDFDMDDFICANENERFVGAPVTGWTYA